MTAAIAVKAALVSALTTAFTADANVVVTYGHPGTTLSDQDYIGVMDVGAEQATGPLGVQRRREETLEATVQISCAMGGGPEAQQPVTERAFALLDTIQTTLRTDPSLGGVSWSAELASYVAAEAIWWSPPEPGYDPYAIGRLCEIAAVVKVVARV